MPKKTIFVVDDEKLILDSNKEILEKAGYNVITAASGQEALKKIKGKKIELALVDVLMPGMSGIELAKNIRKEPSLQNLKIAYLTILTFSNEQRRELKKLNVLDCIQKPFETKELLLRVKKLIKK